MTHRACISGYMRMLALIYVSSDSEMRLYSAESGDTLDSSSILSMQVTSVDIWNRIRL